jgi:NAD(P)-dependent dehydrogenase (short-subunit alcohol dehydrogenase family)
MADNFIGKVALVTGGASGIGRATSFAFADKGAAVVVSDVDVEGGEETVAIIKKEGGDALFVYADVSKGIDMEALVDRTLEFYGRLDYAVNNAGIEGVLAPTVDYPEATFDRVIAVNLKGVWLGMKYEIPKIIASGGGAIVNVASILSLVGFANAAAYTAAKHGVAGLTKVAALEYSARGVRVNAVCPGFIETPMVMERGVEAGTHPEVKEQIAALHPIGRMGKPEEIADAITWLCSDAASFVAGHLLTADGAYTAT